MGMIAIDKLYINKMPKSCKECPLTYLDTGDDAFFGVNERRCVIDDSCVDGIVSERSSDCPLVEAIPKDQYEARLKADMVAILEDLLLQIDELTTYNLEVAKVQRLIRDKIDKLKENNNKIDKSNK